MRSLQSGIVSWFAIQKYRVPSNQSIDFLFCAKLFSIFHPFIHSVIHLFPLISRRNINLFKFISDNKLKKWRLPVRDRKSYFFYFIFLMSAINSILWNATTYFPFQDEEKWRRLEKVVSHIHGHIFFFILLPHRLFIQFQSIYLKSCIIQKILEEKPQRIESGNCRKLQNDNDGIDTYIHQNIKHVTK